MTTPAHLYETAFGWCALLWRGDAILAAQLPLADRDATWRRVLQRFPDAATAEAPGWVRAIAEAVSAHFRDGAQDLSHAPLAFEAVPAFDRAVYELVRRIPPGETTTYGEIARALNGQAQERAPEDARRVGQVMGANPFPPLVPCHRVVSANGRIGGFSAFGGIETKIRMLQLEKARLGAADGLFGALPLAVKPR